MQSLGQKKQGIKGLRCEIIKDDGFTPCLFVEVDATSDKKVRAFRILLRALG